MGGDNEGQLNNSFREMNEDQQKQFLTNINDELVDLFNEINPCKQISLDLPKAEDQERLK